MAIATVKVKIKIQGKVVPVDKYFLDLLSVARFNERYERDEVRKKIGGIVRELVANESHVSPQVVDQKIALSLLPKKKQALMFTEGENCE